MAGALTCTLLNAPFSIFSLLWYGEIYKIYLVNFNDILRAAFVPIAKLSQSQKLIREKLQKTLLYKKLLIKWRWNW